MNPLNELKNIRAPFYTFLRPPWSNNPKHNPSLPSEVRNIVVLPERSIQFDTSYCLETRKILVFWPFFARNSSM